MPVQAQLGPPRRIAANFEEHRAEIGIINIEVVVVDVDGLVARVLEPAIDFLALECLCLLLRHAYEHDPIANPALLPDAVGDVIFPLFMIELIEGNLLLFRHHLYRIAELLGDLPQHHRRGDRFA